MNFEKVDPRSLNRGSKQHESLTLDQQSRVDKIHSIIGQHISFSIDEFKNGFLHDHNPNREITIFEAISQTYFEEMKTRSMLRKVSKKERDLLFNATFAISLCSANHNEVLNDNPKLKGLSNLRSVIKRYLSIRIKQNGGFHQDDSITIQG